MAPCPPISRHRSVHKLYALGTVLPVLRTATKAALEKAMQGNLLARSEQVGFYRKKKQGAPRRLAPPRLQA